MKNETRKLLICFAQLLINGQADANMYWDPVSTNTQKPDWDILSFYCKNEVGELLVVFSRPITIELTAWMRVKFSIIYEALNLKKSGQNEGFTALNNVLWYKHLKCPGRRVLSLMGCFLHRFK